jgi:hypothetical protein
MDLYPIATAKVWPYRTTDILKDSFPATYDCPYCGNEEWVAWGKRVQYMEIEPECKKSLCLRLGLDLDEVLAYYDHVGLPYPKVP